MVTTRAAKIAASSLFAVSAVALIHPPGNAKKPFGRFLDLSSSTPTQRRDLANYHLQDRLLRPSDQYVWLYKDKDGSPTSWGKYTVRDSTDDGVVLIEMATKFSQQEEYSTHHRMRVDMTEHLASFGDRGDWRIGFEYLDGKNWMPFGKGDNVQAFEEKFDVFSMIHMTEDDGMMMTRVVDVDDHELTLTRSTRHNYTEAWYAPSNHPLAGVAVLKQFAEHSFTLISIKRDGDDEVEIKVSA